MHALDEHGPAAEFVEEHRGGAFAVFRSGNRDVGEEFGFGKVGRDEGCAAHQFSENRPGPALQQGGSVAGGQYGVDDDGNRFVQARERELNRAGDVIRREHADLDDRWCEISEQDPKLIEGDRGEHGHDAADALAVLDREGRDGGRAVEPVGSENLEVGLEACSARGIGSSNREGTPHCARW